MLFQNFIMPKKKQTTRTEPQTRYQIKGLNSGVTKNAAYRPPKQPRIRIILRKRCFIFIINQSF
jgi:hypothetical protein